MTDETIKDLRESLRLAENEAQQLRENADAMTAAAKRIRAQLAEREAAEGGWWPDGATLNTGTLTHAVRDMTVDILGADMLRVRIQLQDHPVMLGLTERDAFKLERRLAWALTEMAKARQP